MQGLVARTVSPYTAAAALIVVAAGALRVHYAWTDHGVFWPDEIHQSIEPAHRWVFGYGFRVWEFRDGARSWLFPALLGLVLKAGTLAGVTSGMGLMRLVKIAMALVGTGGVHLAMRVADRAGGKAAALLAGAMVGFFPAFVVYGHRCMTEVASATVVLAAMSLAQSGGGRSWAAGALASIACFLRYQNGLLAVGVFAVLLGTRRFRDAARYAAAGGAVALLLGGALDQYTWGHAFHSFRVYFKFNVVEGKAAEIWGREPAGYFLRTMWTSSGWTLLVVAAGWLACAARPRAWPLVLLGGAYLAALESVPLKQFRYFVPALPLLLTASAVGLSALLGRAARAPAGLLATAAACAALALAWSARASAMTFEQMGQYEGSDNGGRRVLHREEGPNLVFGYAGALPDLCGIAMVGVPIISAGGYSYLHKDVPLYWGLNDLANANYVALPWSSDPPAGYAGVRTFDSPDGAYVLYRRAGGCRSAERAGTRDL